MSQSSRKLPAPAITPIKIHDDHFSSAASAPAAARQEDWEKVEHEEEEGKATLFPAEIALSDAEPDEIALSDAEPDDSRQFPTLEKATTFEEQPPNLQNAGLVKYGLIQPHQERKDPTPQPLPANVKLR